MKTPLSRIVWIVFIVIFGASFVYLYLTQQRDSGPIPLINTNTFDGTTGGPADEYFQNGSGTRIRKFADYDEFQEFASSHLAAYGGYGYGDVATDALRLESGAPLAARPEALSDDASLLGEAAGGI